MVTVVNLNYRRCDIKVTRPSVYGNPFSHLAHALAIRVKDRDTAIDQFAELWYSENMRIRREQALWEIPAGATLGCVCVPKRCHAEIIAGYLNWKRAEFNGPKARTVIYG